MITYQEAWQRITTAYVNDELNPWMDCACFVGNLLQSGDWSEVRTGASYGNIDYGDCVVRENYNGHSQVGFAFVAQKGYTPEEVVSLESNFLKTIHVGTSRVRQEHKKSHINYENALFEAMTSTLEMLRQIHISKGENVEEIVLEKRVLKTA